MFIFIQIVLLNVLPVRQCSVVNGVQVVKGIELKMILSVYVLKVIMMILSQKIARNVKYLIYRYLIINLLFIVIYLIGFYPMDNNLQDLSELGNDLIDFGVIEGDEDRHNNSNGAYKFSNQNNAYLTIPTKPELNFGISDLSIL